MGQIHELLPKVAADTGAVAKGMYNEQQGYKFRGIDQLQNAVHPALVKHGVVVYPVVLSKDAGERQTKSGASMRFVELVIEYHWVAPDGSEIVCTVVGEAADLGDKASNKAMSAAYKYALIQTLCIPLASEEDADASSPQFSDSYGGGQQRTVKQAASAAASGSGATDAQLNAIKKMSDKAGIDDLNIWGAAAVGGPPPWTKTQASKMIEALGELLPPRDA